MMTEAVKEAHGNVAHTLISEPGVRAAGGARVERITEVELDQFYSLSKLVDEERQCAKISLLPTKFGTITTGPTPRWLTPRFIREQGIGDMVEWVSIACAWSLTKVNERNAASISHRTRRKITLSES
jgi:hypothetical protein